VHYIYFELEINQTLRVELCRNHHHLKYAMAVAEMLTGIVALAMSPLAAQCV
jgi:hypothetical protein